MKRTLNWQRFWLALISMAGLIAAGVGIFLVLGWKVTLDAVSVGLLTLLIRELGGGKASAFAWFFDGSADKPPPEPGTSTTTTAAVVAPVKPVPSKSTLGTAPAGTVDDPVAVHEVSPTAVKGTP